MACVNCQRDVTILARGLCKACYARWQRTGSTDYAPKRERTFCQIDRCGKPVVSHGLCDMHRIRLRDHGTVDQSDWGSKSKHPMYHSWKWMHRHKAQHPINPSWDDFYQFTLDIGDRPGPRHKLFSADDSKPLGPGNFVWKTAITQRVEGEDDRTYRNRQRRVHNSVNVEAFKGYELKKNYGLSRDEYMAISEKQDHKCAICDKPESAKIRGKTLALAVDHCHDKGHVRGLLCMDCNRGLGMFKDDVTLLQKAIKYLE